MGVLNGLQANIRRCDFSFMRPVEMHIHFYIIEVFFSGKEEYGYLCQQRRE